MTCAKDMSSQIVVLLRYRRGRCLEKVEDGERTRRISHHVFTRSIDPPQVPPPQHRQGPGSWCRLRNFQLSSSKYLADRVETKTSTCR